MSPWSPLSRNTCTRMLALSDDSRRPLITGADLRCTLIEIDLKHVRPNGGSFDALSYVWGPENQLLPIFCNNVRLPIRKNLSQALLSIWSAKPTRTIWVDALCINQEDDQEKSAQVAMMHRIFSQANIVIIWFGLHDPFIKQAWEIISSDASTTMPQFEAKQGIKAREGIAKLVQHRWFYRVWTYQEVILAKAAVVRCGHLEVAWTRFYKNCLAHTARDDYEPRRDHVMLERLFTQHDSATDDMDDDQTQVSFTKSILNTRHRNASDPRDKIYALLGLPGFGLSLTLSPDYTKSISATYAAATLECIRMDQDLLILTAAGRNVANEITNEVERVCNDARPTASPEKGSITKKPAP